MGRCSRRGFVQLSTAAVAMAALGRIARADALAGRGLGADDVDGARAVAMTALDAARRAGASYADVRVDATVSQAVGVWQGRASGPVSYGDHFAYGVRVLVHGQWGFAGDQDPATDVIAMCAGRAVAQARATSRDIRPMETLVPTPVVSDGRWETAIAVDPFTVPIGAQEETLRLAIAAARAVRGVGEVGGSLRFSRTVRTFASTDGSVIRQTFGMAEPSATAFAAAANDAGYTVGRRVRSLMSVQGGYEVVRDARLDEKLVAAAEAAVRATRARPIDVGRYDVVVSGSVMAAMVATLIGRAVAVPVGRTVATPAITVTADRSLSAGVATVGWDDEGVAPETFALIDAGVVVDHPTTRSSAGVARSNGCAVGGGLSTPRAGMPNLTIEPGHASGSVHDLIAGVRRGVYLSEDAGGGGGVTRGVEQWSASSVQEIRDGRLLGYVRDAALQARDGELWQALDAIGGRGSIEQASIGGATVRAVPARFRGVNLVSTGTMG